MQIINGVECRTREESLRHIAQRAKLKKIGPKREEEDGCEYRYASGNNCAVGSLFNEAQLKSIDEAGYNESAIDYVAKAFLGKRNVETVTGMKVSELKLIQEIHDNTLQNHSPQAARDGVRVYCEQQLEKLQKSQKTPTLAVPEKTSEIA